MSADICALSKLLMAVIDRLQSTPRDQLLPSERRFLFVMEQYRVELAMIAMTARLEMDDAAQTVLAGGDLRRSPERGGTGPGPS